VAGEDRLWNWQGQGSRRKAVYQVIVGGEDITPRLDPHLISLNVTDKEDSIDKCAIELDDRDAKLMIPPDAAPIEVWLGWHTEGMYQVFEGLVDSVESGFGRKQGGRRLWIDASGTAMKSNVKSPMTMTWGEGAPPGSSQGNTIPLKQVLEEAAKKAGLSAKISSQLGGLKRDFWHMGNESFQNFGQRLARELGGVFKISGGKASLTSATDYTNVDGEKLDAIIAEWGKNLIAWRIKPYAGRPQYKEAAAHFYDLQKSIFDKVTKGIGGAGPFGAAEAIAALPMMAPNKQVGEQTNAGLDADSTRRRGTGWVQLNGEPLARAGSPLTIIGARPGVDGTYRIEEAEHTYSRRGGYLTRCTVNNPAFPQPYTPDWPHPGRPETPPPAAG
jgi:uncharacterized protein